MVKKNFILEHKIQVGLVVLALVLICYLQADKLMNVMQPSTEASVDTTQSKTD